jgi:hypothetical protein
MLGLKDIRRGGRSRQRDVQQRGNLPEALASLERCRVYGMRVGKVGEDALVL